MNIKTYPYKKIVPLEKVIADYVKQYVPKTCRHSKVIVISGIAECKVCGKAF